MEKLNQCPVCEGKSLDTFMSVDDHFLSREKFELVKCTSCSFVFTNPRPKAAELQKYYESEDYFSHSKKKKGLITFLYDTVKSHSLSKKYTLISKYKSGGKILDIGCATGEFLNYFKQKGWETTGIEPAENPRNFAIENYGLDVKPEESLDALKPASFDVITMWHVLEHVPELNDRMQQIKKLLKPDGLLLVALPNYLSWDAKHYKSFWAGYDVPRHLYHFSKSTVSRIFSKHQLKLIDTVPLKFDAFYVSLLSEKYQSGKMNYVKAFLNGMKSNSYAGKHNTNYSSLVYLIQHQNS
jgi:2-polyprenyl-3-methyl-5-hydroxy-6-metoxy-1,4-benzoquinol methylase